MVVSFKACLCPVHLSRSLIWADFNVERKSPFLKRRFVRLAIIRVKTDEHDFHTEDGIKSIGKDSVKIVLTSSWVRSSWVIMITMVRHLFASLDVSSGSGLVYSRSFTAWFAAHLWISHHLSNPITLLVYKRAIVIRSAAHDTLFIVAKRHRDEHVLTTIIVSVYFLWTHWSWGSH